MISRIRRTLRGARQQRFRASVGQRARACLVSHWGNCLDVNAALRRTGETQEALCAFERQMRPRQDAPPLALMSEAARLTARCVLRPTSPLWFSSHIGRGSRLARLRIVRARVNSSPNLGEQVVRELEQHLYSLITQAVVNRATTLFG